MRIAGVQAETARESRCSFAAALRRSGIVGRAVFGPIDRRNARSRHGGRTTGGVLQISLSARGMSVWSRKSTGRRDHTPRLLLAQPGRSETRRVNGPRPRNWRTKARMATLPASIAAHPLVMGALMSREPLARRRRVRLQF